MANQIIQVAPDSTGKKIQTYENTVGANTVQAQAVVLVDSSGNPISVESPLTFQHSVSRTANTVNLVNDAATPGNNKEYGTNSAGTKGWYSYASLQIALQNPTNTTSTTTVMLGLGSVTWGTAIITPTASGKIMVTIFGTLVNNTAGASTYVQIRYGTGTAPNNGAAGTAGTAVGGIANRGGAGAAAALVVPFSLTGIITGLALGTAVWLDLSFAVIGASTGTVQNVAVAAIEIP